MTEDPRPQVTVVIPTRDRAAMLRQAMACVLGQRGVDVGLIVVDEASTDDTAAWLATLEDPRITVLRNDQPQGPTAARNSGIALADTPWVAFCDDDDLWAPDKLALQLAALSGDPKARWSTTGTVSVDSSLQIIGHQRPPASGDVGAALELHNVVPAGASTVVVERSLLEEVGGFDVSLAACEDYDLWCRLGRAAPLSALDHPLIAYRVAAGSRSSDVGVMRATHAAVVARHRAAVDPHEARNGDLIFDQYMARFPLRQGRRAEAAWAYLAIARRYRLPTHVVHAGLALLAPGWANGRRARAERAEVPPWWLEEAEAWLAPVRDDAGTRQVAAA